MNDLLDSYTQKIPELNVDREYWFIRTESGHFYETFITNDFVAIGWDYITIEDIIGSKEDEEKLRKKIVKTSIEEEKKNAEKEEREVNEKNYLNRDKPSNKGKITTIINKIWAFHSMKKGDIVVIPNSGSGRFSFGIVDDLTTYIDNEGKHKCPYRKRRKIKWITEKKFRDIGPIFYMFKKNMHAISSVKDELAEKIDSVMNAVYFKDGHGHYRISVKQEENIKAGDLFGLGSDLLYFLDKINIKYGLSEPVDETIVKVNVQSKGDLLFKGGIGKSIIGLSLFLSAVSCNKEEQLGLDLTQDEKEMVEGIRTKMDSMRIDVQTYGE